MATAERDYYEVLGVERGASDAEIKRAFRRLARELHPDVNDAPDAGARFREVVEAYEVLSSAETRRLYDRYGAAGLRRSGFEPQFGDFGHLSDVFAAFFGDAFFAAPTAQQAARGADVQAAVEISMADAFSGTTRPVGIRIAATCERCDGHGAEPGTAAVTCPDCGGAGRVQHVSRSVFGQFVRTGPCTRCDGAGRVVESPCEACRGEGRVLVERELELDVPRGIHDGQRIRLRGEGHAGVRGGSSGDLLVQVRVRSDGGVVRDGDDLLVTAGVTMTQAALGTSVTVATPEGAIDVAVPAGTQPQTTVTLRGRGMPSLGSDRRGDLHVRVEVLVPRALTDEQRGLVEALDESLDDDAYREDEGFFDRLKNAFR